MRNTLYEHSKLLVILKLWTVYKHEFTNVQMYKYYALYLLLLFYIEWERMWPNKKLKPLSVLFLPHTHLKILHSSNFYFPIKTFNHLGFLILKHVYRKQFSLFLNCKLFV